MDGLDACRDTQLPQPGGVFGAGEFEVLNAVASAGGAAFLEGVDGEGHGGVADGVQCALQTRAVGVGDDGFKVSGCPEGVWMGVCRSVGFGEGGGAGVDDAVEDEFDASDAAVG